MSLQYKLDNEFELVFVVAYQNILKLSYVDKFLNEIQLRFRDKYKREIQSGQLNHDFSRFSEDFKEILKECEEEARLLLKNQPKPRRYEESLKSQTTVGSMVKKNEPTLLGSLLNSALSPSSPPTGNSNTKAPKLPVEENADGDSGCEAGSVAEDLKINKLNLSENGTVRKVGGKPKFVPKAK